jgi:hypothetical protein
MTDINWGLLGRPVDIGGAVQQGFAAGQLQRRQRETQDILAGYGANPSAGVPGALWALDPDTAATLSQNDRQRVVAERQTQDALRQGQARGLYADVLAQRPAGGGVSGVAAPSRAATTNADGDIIVQAPTASAAPATSIADVARLDPQLAADLTKHIGDLDKNGREAFAQQTGVGAAVALAASHLPASERAAFIDSQAPLLRQAGWSQEQLAGFDPTDENLKGMISIGVGADKIIADDRAAAGQAITVRGQDVSAATARRGQDISASTTRRGQDIGAATARAGQAVAMRGQDMQAATRAAPKPATMALAKTKLTALDAIDNQLNRVEKALAKAKYRGPIAGRWVPGGISGPDSAADAAIRQLAPLVRQLTRVPGEGAMSDYESRLAEAGQPSRSQTAEGLQETLAGYRDLINATRSGYQDLVGETPAPRRGGFKVVR